VVEFGLPHPPGADSESVNKTWADLMETADRQVLADFPKLKFPPEHRRDEPKVMPSRLYNGIVPLKDDSVAFAGHVILSNAFRTTEAQAIWITAYFDRYINIHPRNETMKKVAYINAFPKRRYPSHGAIGNYFHLDLVGYTDKLMADIGLVSHKQKG
jgi:dimethylaniline monooxygenase (N-oxide forming)